PSVVAVPGLLDGYRVPIWSDDLPFARSFAPDSWFVDSVVSGVESGILDQSDRVFTREAVLEGPRFFARESRFDFTPRGNSDDIANERSDRDRKLFFKTGIEALRETFEQTDLYYSVFRHFRDVDFHLLWSLSTGDADVTRHVNLVDRDDNDRSGNGPSLLTRADVQIKASRIVDNARQIVDVRGWLFDLVEFTVFPLDSEVKLRLPIYSDRNFAIDVLGGIERSP